MISLSTFKKGSQPMLIAIPQRLEFIKINLEPPNNPPITDRFYFIEPTQDLSSDP